MYLGNKYIVILTFDDFGLTVKDITIGITGEVKVKFDKKKFKSFSRDQILSLKSSVYIDMIPHIIDNLSNLKRIKLELNHFHNHSSLAKYEVLSSKIDDVYDLVKRTRKKKIIKLNGNRNYI